MARLRQCAATLNAGENEAGEALAVAVHGDASAAGQHWVTARSALLLAMLKQNCGEMQAAIAWARRSVDAGVDAADRHVQASGWVIIAGAAAADDLPADALDAAERALLLADEGTHAELRRTIFTGLMLTYAALGLPHLALPAARRAWEAEQASPDPLDRLRARWNLVNTALKAHDQYRDADAQRAEAALAEALEHLPPMLAMADACEVPYLRAGALHAAGMARLREGRVAEAVAHLQACLATPTEEPPAELMQRWLDLAEAERAAGATGAAQAAVEQAAAQAARVSPGDAARNLGLQVRLAELNGDASRALALHRRFHAKILNNVLAAFERRVAELTHQVAAQALRLENADLRERNQDLASDVQRLSVHARTDALTSLLNRGALEAAFADLQARATRFAVLLFDLDHFKAVNDRLSHAVGDAVLRRVGALLAETLRAPDLAGRYGGEEFMVLVASDDLTGAAAVGERLRQRVAAEAWSAISPGLAVTLSGGVVLAGPGEGFAAVVGRADRLLYRAKREGRNRVIAGAPVPRA
jgi:diguanylate cyclase (GGDEF)-like protein